MRASCKRVRSTRRISAACLLAAYVAATPIALGAAQAHAQGQVNAQPASATLKRVATRFVVADTPRAVDAGQRAVITGRLKPAHAGERVALMLHERGRWVTVDHDRTRRSGRFTVSTQLSGLGAHMARVRFAGNRAERPDSTKIGLMLGLEPAVASWYYDAGDTACGFHATYGVANRSLPCGARVQLYYDGRVVTATVDDRGPYVAGRTFDLDQNTAAALGMEGVATVLAS